MLWQALLRVTIFLYNFASTSIMTCVALVTITRIPTTAVGDMANCVKFHVVCRQF